jgi:hypothetical protein
MRFTTWVRWISRVPLWLPGFVLAAAQFPSRIAQLDLPGSPWAARITPDHHYAAVIMGEGLAGLQQRLVLIDLSSLSNPAQKSALPLQGQVIQLEIAPDAKLAVLQLRVLDAGQKKEHSYVAGIDLSVPGKPRR